MDTDPGPTGLEPWPVLAVERGPDLRLFRVRLDRVRSPRTGRDLRAVVLETPDWVNVVALTGERNVVLVRQYRFGIRDFGLEVPGGMVDPGEEPLAAARRELREESGYEAAEWKQVGVVEPNPAFHTNRCFTYLATGAVRRGDPQPDPGEDLEVLTLPAADVARLVRENRITNSLVVAGLARVLDLRSEEV